MAVWMRTMRGVLSWFSPALYELPPPCGVPLPLPEELQFYCQCRTMVWCSRWEERPLTEERLLTEDLLLLLLLLIRLLQRLHAR